MKGTVKEKLWTYEDYLKLEDDKRYEIIKGRLMEMPAPSVSHQRIVGVIYKILDKKVGDKGEVIISPVDVVLSNDVVVQPDVIVILTENKGIIGDRIYGSPDIVVEVVSPNSYTRDRYEKFKVYEEFKVKEYWILLPGEKTIEVWCLKRGKYILHSVASEKGEIESYVLKGLKVKVEEVFK